MGSTQRQLLVAKKGHDTNGISLLVAELRLCCSRALSRARNQTSSTLTLSLFLTPFARARARFSPSTCAPARLLGRVHVLALNHLSRSFASVSSSLFSTLSSKLEARARASISKCLQARRRRLWRAHVLLARLGVKIVAPPRRKATKERWRGNERPELESIATCCCRGCFRRCQSCIGIWWARFYSLPPQGGNSGSGAGGGGESDHGAAAVAEQCAARRRVALDGPMGASALAWASRSDNTARISVRAPAGCQPF